MYLIDRRKPEGTHLEYATRVRFTAEEDADITRQAILHTGGLKAPWIRRCTLVGQEVLKAHHEQLLAALIERRPLCEGERQALARLVGEVIEHGMGTVANTKHA